MGAGRNNKSELPLPTNVFDTERFVQSIIHEATHIIQQKGGVGEIKFPEDDMNMLQRNLYIYNSQRIIGETSYKMQVTELHAFNAAKTAEQIAKNWMQ